MGVFVHIACLVEWITSDSRFEMYCIIFISNVVKVGFVLHVYVGACPLSGKGHLGLTGIL